MRVLIEVLVPDGHAVDLSDMIDLLQPVPIKPDDTYPPVASGRAEGDRAIFLIRAEVTDSARAELEAHPNVHAVWNDTPVEPFGGSPAF